MSRNNKAQRWRSSRAAAAAAYVLQGIAEDIRQRGDVGNGGPNPADYLDHWSARLEGPDFDLAYESIDGLIKMRRQKQIALPQAFADHFGIPTDYEQRP